MLSRRWQSSVFAFDVPTLLQERIPFVVAMLAREFSWPGLIVAGSGVVYLVRYELPLAVLFGIAGLLNVLFVLVYDIVEIAVFLLPTVLTGWLCAAVLVGHAHRWNGRLGQVSKTIVAVVGWAGWHAQRGYAASDRSHEFQEIRRFDALFRNLPARSLIVSNDYLVDSMLRYKLLGEGAAGQRDIRGPERPEPARLRELHRNGFAIFAFAQHALQLRLNGFRFAEAPLFETVTQHLRFLPRGTVVAIASSLDTGHVLTGQTLGRIAGQGPPLSGRTAGGVVGIVNTGGAPQEEWSPEGVQLNLATGDEIGTTGVTLRTDLTIRADSTVGRIT